MSDLSLGRGVPSAAPPHGSGRAPRPAAVGRDDKSRTVQTLSPRSPRAAVPSDSTASSPHSPSLGQRSAQADASVAGGRTKRRREADDLPPSAAEPGKMARADAGQGLSPAGSSALDALFEAVVADGARPAELSVQAADLARSWGGPATDAAIRQAFVDAWAARVLAHGDGLHAQTVRASLGAAMRGLMTESIGQPLDGAQSLPQVFAALRSAWQRHLADPARASASDIAYIHGARCAWQALVDEQASAALRAAVLRAALPQVLPAPATLPPADPRLRLKPSQIGFMLMSLYDDTRMAGLGPTVRQGVLKHVESQLGQGHPGRIVVACSVYARAVFAEGNPKSAVDPLIARLVAVHRDRLATASSEERQAGVARIVQALDDTRLEGLVWLRGGASAVGWFAYCFDEAIQALAGAFASTDQTEAQALLRLMQRCDPLLAAVGPGTTVSDITARGLALGLPLRPAGGSAVVLDLFLQRWSEKLTQVEPGQLPLMSALLRSYVQATGASLAPDSPSLLAATHRLVRSSVDINAAGREDVLAAQVECLAAAADLHLSPSRWVARWLNAVLPHARDMDVTDPRATSADFWPAAIRGVAQLIGRMRADVARTELTEVLVGHVVNYGIPRGPDEARLAAMAARLKQSLELPVLLRSWIGSSVTYWDLPRMSRLLEAMGVLEGHAGGSRASEIALLTAAAGLASEATRQFMQAYILAGAQQGARLSAPQLLAKLSKLAALPQDSVPDAQLTQLAFKLMLAGWVHWLSADEVLLEGGGLRADAVRLGVVIARSGAELIGVLRRMDPPQAEEQLLAFRGRHFDGDLRGRIGEAATEAVRLAERDPRFCVLLTPIVEFGAARLSISDFERIRAVMLANIERAAPVGADEVFELARPAQGLDDGIGPGAQRSNLSQRLLVMYQHFLAAMPRSGDKLAVLDRITSFVASERAHIAELPQMIQAAVTDLLDAADTRTDSHYSWYRN